MVLSALILFVQELFFISLISLAIVRAFVSKILRVVGIPPLVFFSLLAILSIYGYYYISTTRCCASSDDEECKKKDLEPEVVEGGSTSLTTHKQVNHLFPSLLAVVP
jgi:hypothetical protein